MDPDDYVDLDFYEKLYLAATAKKSDIATASVKIFKCNGRVQIINNLKKIAKSRVYFGNIHTVVIYRREFLKKNEIVYPNLILGEDSLFLTKAVFRANDIVLVPGTYYNYIRRADSLHSEYLSSDQVKSKIIAHNKMTDLINDSDLNKKDYMIAFSRQLKWTMSTLSRPKNPLFEDQILITKYAIEIFNKCKYPESLNMDDELWNLLAGGNEIGVLAFLTKRERFLLLGFLPLLTIRNKNFRTRYKLFGFIPIVRKYKSRSTILHSTLSK